MKNDMTTTDKTYPSRHKACAQPPGDHEGARQTDDGGGCDDEHAERGAAVSACRGALAPALQPALRLARARHAPLPELPHDGHVEHHQQADGDGRDHDQVRPETHR